MADGSVTVGLFNLADADHEVSVTWQDLGIEGRRRPRDVWRQSDAAGVAGTYKAVVPRHGVALVRLFRKGFVPAARRQRRRIHRGLVEVSRLTQERSAAESRAVERELLIFSPNEFLYTVGRHEPRSLVSTTVQVKPLWADARAADHRRRLPAQ